MRTVAAAALVLAAMSAAAQAAPCRNGSTMPGSDANPAKPIDPNQARVVCETGSLPMVNADGKHIGDQKTWNFSVRDKDGNRVR